MQNVEFKREEINLLVCELESIIPELRGIIASGGRKELVTRTVAFALAFAPFEESAPGPVNALTQPDVAWF